MICLVLPLVGLDSVDEVSQENAYRVAERPPCYDVVERMTRVEELSDSRTCRSVNYDCEGSI
jgi:hypothetical protein